MAISAPSAVRFCSGTDCRTAGGRLIYPNELHSRYTQQTAAHAAESRSETLMLDAAGLTLLKQFEGCRLDAYQDTAGVWTIGYGHIVGVVEGMTISQAQADQLLLADTLHVVSVATTLLAGVATVTYQFDAMVSLAFNIGSRAFRSSTVLRQHRAGKYLAAGDAFLLWDKDHQDGQLVVVPGLLKRRKIERACAHFNLNVPVSAGRKRTPR
jgi:lysozyme